MEYKREHFKVSGRRRTNPALLTTDREGEKLFAVLCNYLSLSQFELARTVLDQLFQLGPERVTRVLRSLVLAEIPTQWLFSESVPTGAHLAWLAMVEYRTQHERAHKGGFDEANQKAWDVLNAKLKNTAVNPLGFMSHDRFAVQVLEAKSLKIFENTEFESDNAVSFHVKIEVEGKEYETQPCTDEIEPVWDDTFNCHIVYADSKVKFTVYAERRLRPTARRSAPTQIEAVGVCTLPLHQLRQKTDYHIWIPLESPVPIDTVTNSPYKLMQALRGQGLSQVAKPNFGRVRVRLQWKANPTVKVGDFALRTRKAIETDLLLAAALYNGRKAHFARIRGDPDALPIGDAAADKGGKSSASTDDLSGSIPLLDGTLPDPSVDGFQLATKSPVFSEPIATNVREYAFYLLSAATEANPLLQVAQSKKLPEEFLHADVFHQLRVAIRALPSAGHPLVSTLQSLVKQSALNRQYNLAELATPSKFQSLYATLVAESLLKREYHKAVGSLSVLARDVVLSPSSNELLDDVFRGVVSYIHDAHTNTEKCQSTLVQLLATYTRALQMNADAVVSVTEREQAATELQQFSNTHMVRHYQERLLRQVQAYSALIGTDDEFALHRFCQLEDAHIYGGPEQKRAFPLCFLSFHRALETLDKLGLASEQLQMQRELCLSTFYGEYYTFARVTQQHVLQYVVRKALGFAKARNWKEASIVVRPFSRLRPLVVLVAWDEFEDDFATREDLIQHLWRDRPSFPAEPCSEPRLTEWCNRLDFNVRLINTVLSYLEKASGVQFESVERNDKAIRLLDTLRLHSILYAFRDYLPSLPPHVLLDLLQNSDEPDRGAETDHDLHVLRSYYAIRTVMGLMLGDLFDPLLQQIAHKGRVPHDEGGTGVADSEYSDDEKEQESKVVLMAAQKYLLGMSKVEFQVTTLEKIFCLLFMQEKDVLTPEELALEEAAMNKKIEEAKRKVMQENYEEAGDDAIDLVTRGRPESPMVLDIVKCQSLLLFMRDTVGRVKTAIQERHRDNPDPKLMSSFARLEGLRFHIEEGVWRLSILRHLNRQPTMELLVAPLDTISTIFLRLDRLEDARLKEAGALSKINQLGNAVVVERWQQLCALVRERTQRSKAGDIVEGVIEFIANFYKDPEANVKTESGAPAAGVMQGFFFAMDVAINFSHALNTKQYQNLIDYAIAFLKATEPSQDTPEAIELYQFYMAYAKHCRGQNRTRFNISQAYDLARSSGMGQDADEDEVDDSSSLTRWVQAYRLGNYKKKMGRGESVVDGGWLSSSTGKPEDNVRRMSQRRYMETYRDYCHELAIVSISDALSDTTYKMVMQTRAEKKHDNTYDDDEDDDDSDPRASPWRDIRVVDYLVRVSSDATAIERQQRSEHDPLRPMTLSERLERVRTRMHVLSKKLMPSLAIIRCNMLLAHEGSMMALSHAAREQSQFLPAYHRFVDWRVSMFEGAMKAVVTNEDGALELATEVRDLLAFEDIAHDQAAYVKLLRRFISRDDLRTGDKMLALDLADRVINPDTTTPEAENLVQELLLLIVNDEGYSDDALRARCILRLKDMVWAAQMTLKYVDEWPDPELCLQVLLKCLSDMKASHPLRPKIAFKYNTILIFQELSQSFTQDNASAYLERKKLENPNMTHDEALSILRLFQSWGGFEQECYGGLARSLRTLLDAQQVITAQKLFELYLKSHAMAETFAFSMDRKDEDVMADLIEAGSISLCFRAQSGSSERMQGLRRLEQLPDEKTVFIGRALMSHIRDVAGRFVVAEWLSRFMEQQRSMQQASRKSGQSQGMAFTADERDWMSVMKISTRLLVLVPAAIRADWSYNVLVSPTRIMRALLEGNHMELVSKALPHFLAYKGQEITVSGDVKRHEPEKQSDDDVLSHVAANAERYNPFSVILGFAYEVLTLEREDMGRDAGFLCLDLVLLNWSGWPFRERERQTNVPVTTLVGGVVLDSVNGLACKLGHADHPLFILNVMKNLLVYFKAKLEPILSSEHGTPEVSMLLDRHDKYRKLVFTAQELTQLDQTQSKGDSKEPDSKESESESKTDLPLLYSLRRVKFTMEDLIEPTKAAELRSRLMEVDKLDLARRVWVECEDRDASEFDRQFQSKTSELQDVCEQFDNIPGAAVRASQ